MSNSPTSFSQAAMRLALLTVCTLSAALAAAAPDPGGIPGHVKVEAQTPAGWVELVQPAYALAPAVQTLAVPGAWARDGRLTLRLSAPDNDETQLDWLAVDSGTLVKVAEAAGGASRLKKLLRLDHDVAEIHGRPLLATLRVPQGVESLTLRLAARSSNNASIPRRPFRLGAAAVAGAPAGSAGPLRLDAREGAALRLDTGPLASGSGHPMAPLLGDLRVRQGHLRGHLDFGPDNDPGDDDYAAVVAYGADGQAKTFKVTPAETAYGRARWAYGQAAPWQHMSFDLDVPLAELPRARDGRLKLELLAYGTCSAAGPNNDYYATGVSAPAVSIPDNLTVTASFGYIVNAGSAVTTNLTTTVRIWDPYGVTLSSQTLNSTYDGGSCAITPPLTVYYNPTCSGTYTLWATVVGGPGDPTPNSAAVSNTVAVSGGSPCVAPTATPTSTPGLTAASVDIAVSSPRVGQPMLIAFRQPATSAGAKIYNLAGEVVAELKDGVGSLSWDTAKASPGVYLLKVKATLADGSTVEAWKKAVLQP